MSDNIIARLFKASAQANADQVQQVVITQAADDSLILNVSINVSMLSVLMMAYIDYPLLPSSPFSHNWNKVGLSKIRSSILTAMLTVVQTEIYELEMQI